MIYFAQEESEKIGKELVKKCEDYYKYLRDSSMLSELRESHRTYFGQSWISERGSQGELKKICVNHYANLIRHLLVMVTSQRPAFEPRASNSDHKSQSQTILAAGLLDFYMREKRLERLLKKATELALYLREGWISTTWDTKAGDAVAYDPETQETLNAGDITYKVHNILNVIRDVNRKSIEELPWLIVKEQANKWDLSSKYPESADRIQTLDARMNSFDFESELEPVNNRRDVADDDSLELFTFYHEKSASLPDGRMVEFLKDGTVLFDGPLPYRKLPIFPITAGQAEERPFGHSQAFDLLPVQRAIDAEFSTVISNHAAFGVQNVAVPKGSGIGFSSLGGGLNLLEYDSKLGVPQPLNLVQTPPEIFKTIEMLTSVAETLSGVNSIARGNAPASLSGAAMALIQSTSLQFSSGLQASYTALLEDVGTATIQLLQDFAQVPRIAALVGRHNRSLLREFKGEDVAEISRVTVDSANALTKSTAGRVEIANQLLQAGMVIRPEQYIMIIQTGQLEPMLESDTSSLLRIRAENEKLSQGEQVSVMITDPHETEIREHLAILDSPEARENPEIVNNVLNHVQEHIELAKSMPPELMAILGRQPLPSNAPEGMPQVMDNQNPVMEQVEGVNLPQLPNVAGTNQQFDPNNPALPTGEQ